MEVQSVVEAGIDQACDVRDIVRSVLVQKQKVHLAADADRAVRIDRVNLHLQHFTGL